MSFVNVFGKNIVPSSLNVMIIMLIKINLLDGKDLFIK